MSDSSNFLADIYSSNFLKDVYSEDNKQVLYNTLDKSTNAALSLQEKADAIKQKTVNKTANISGYTKGILNIGDGDSGTITLEDGSIIKSRFYSPYSKFLDAIEVDHRDKNALDYIKSNPSKKPQLELASQLLNKPVESLTNEDINKIGTYHTDYIKHLLTKDSIGSPSEFTADKINNHTPSKLNNIEVYFKTTGTVDKYNREFVELLNPKTLEDVTKSIGNNPYINANLNTPEYLRDIATNTIHEPINAFPKGFKQNTEYYFREFSDNNGRILEDIDLAKASFYKSGANILSFMANTTGIGKDAINTAEKGTFLNTIKELRNPERGQEIADMLAGVKPSTRRQYSNVMYSAEKDWENGNYSKSLLKTITQLDKVLSESASQMAAMGVAGAAITSIAPISATLGVSALLLAAADMTEQNAQLYKQNNKKEYTSSQYALDFGLQTALLIPEIVMTKLGLDKFLKKPLASLMKGKFEKTPVSSYLHSVVSNLLGEGSQEYAQGISQEVMTQDRSKARSIFEIASNPSQVFQGAVGAVSGGVVTGVAGIPSTIGNIKTDKTNKINKEKLDNYNKSVTVTGDEIDAAVDTEANTKIDEIASSTSTINFKESINQLDDITVSGASIATAKKAVKEKVNILKKTILTGSTEDINNIENKEETFESIVYHSSPDGKYDDNTKKELTEIGTKLGLDETAINRTFESVDLEAKHGDIGYVTLSNYINKANSILETNPDDESAITLKEYALDQLNYFLNSQIKKVDNYTSTISAIANSPINSSKKVINPDGTSFTIHKSSILNTNSKVHDVFKSFKNNITNISNILAKETGEDYTGRYKSSLESFDNIINFIQDKYKSEIPISSTTTPVVDKNKVNTIYAETRAAILDKTNMPKLLEVVKKEDENIIKEVVTNLAASTNTDRQEASIVLKEAASKVLNTPTKSVDKSIYLDSGITIKGKSIAELTFDIESSKDDYALSLHTIETYKDSVKKVIKELKDDIKIAKTKKNKRNISNLYKSLELAKEELKIASKEHRKIYAKSITVIQNKLNALNESIDNTYIGNTLLKKKALVVKATENDGVNHYDITNVVKRSSKATTLLGTLELNPEVYSKVVNTFLKFIKTTHIQKNIDENSPAYALLFKDGKDIDGNVAFAIHYSLYKVITYFSGIIDPKTREDIAASFNVKPEELTAQDYFLRRTYGNSRSYIAEMLGKEIMSSLGLVVNPNTSKVEYAKLVSNLGNLAVAYGLEKKLLIGRKVDSKELSRILKKPVYSKNGASFIKLNSNNEAMEKVRNSFKNEEHKFSLELQSVKFPSAIPFKKQDAYYVEKNNKLTKAPKKVVNALNKLRATKFTLNTYVSSFVKDNVDIVKHYLGYKEDYSNYSKDDQLSIEAVNRSIDKTVDTLIDLHDTGNTNWFFDVFYGRNGRFYFRSNTVNPQTDKNLHRFALYIKSSIVSFNDLKAVEAFKYHIAQAFGYKVDGNTFENINAFANKILTYNPEELLASLKNKSIKEDFNIKVVHIGQLIAGIEALQNYKNAINQGKDSFVHNLEGEHDSTTSAYVVKFLQFPLKSLSHLFEKVGIQINTDKEINELKTTKDFLDIYKTTAKNLDMEAVAALGYENIAESTLFQNTVSTLAAENSFETLLKIFPSSSEETISDELRDIFKVPTMITGYGAGIASVANNIGKLFTNKLINIYLGTNKDVSVKVIEETTNLFNGIIPYLDIKEELSTVLKTKFLYQIRFKKEFGKFSLEQYLNNLITHSYGAAVGATVVNLYHPLVSINTIINTMFNTMFDNFYSAFTEKIEEYKKANNVKVVPISKEKEFIVSLFSKFPAIKSMLGETSEEGIVIYEDDNKVYDNLTKSTVHYNKKVERDTYSSSVVAKVKELNKAKASGGVLPIHFIDGAIMTEMINTFKLLGIHDAVIVNSNNAFDVVSTYNKLLYSMNKDYNLFGTLFKSFYNSVKDLDGNTQIEVLSDPTKVFKRNKKMISLKQLIYVAATTNKEIIEARKDFYSNKNVYISNMDGIYGTGYKVDNTAYNSNPDTFEYSSDRTKLAEDVLINPVKRLDLFDKLYELHKNNISEEHAEYLKSLLGSINSEFLKNIVVYLNDNASVTKGTYDFVDNEIALDIYRHDASKSNKTAPEAYVHEIIHSITSNVVRNASLYNKTVELRKIMHLQKLASKVITWEHLLPDGIHNEYEKRKAQALWNYMFNNPNIKNNEGVAEFIVHGLTNEKVMNQLKLHYVEKTNKANSLFDKFIKLTRDLLGVFLGATKISDVAPNVVNMLLGNYSPKDVNKTLYNSLADLVANISKVNNKALDELETSSEGTINNFLNLVNQKVTKGNKFLSPYIKSFITLGDKYNITLSDTKLNSTKLEDAAWLVKAAGLMVISSKYRSMLPNILKAVGLSYEGFVQSSVRDFMTPDFDASKGEMLGITSRKIESLSKTVEGTVLNNLLDNLGEITEPEAVSLTEGVLKTDLSCLYNEYGLKGIKEILSSKDKLFEEINKLEKYLSSKTTTEVFSYYKAQSKALANFMLTNIGNPALNKNAYSIAVGDNSKLNLKADKDVIYTIDKLVTLYSLLSLNKDTKNIVLNINNKGLENFLIAHNTFVYKSREYVIRNDRHMVKGYTKDIHDNTVNVITAPLSQEKELNKEGYTLVKKVAGNSIVGDYGLGIYKSTSITMQQRNGATFMFNGLHHIGKSISEVIRHNEYSNDDNVKNMIKKAKDKALKERDMIVDEMLKGTYSDKNNYSTFIPITNLDGETIDFAVSMSNKLKENIFDMDLRGHKVLSKMYAANELKILSEEHNLDILKYLVKDMKKNYVKNNVTGKNLKDYVFISKHAEDPKLKSLYNILPRAIQLEVDNLSDGGLAVRADLVQNFFGVKEISIIDNPLIKKYSNNLGKRAIKLGEDILKHTAYIMKANVVLRTPSVLIGNIISNINLSVAKGISPFKVAAMQAENAKNLTDYLSNKQALNDIIFKKELGTATEEELSKINYYKNRLYHNPVHPLMKRGLFQAIIEDINPEERDATGKLTKYFNKKTAKIPKAVKAVTKQLYMLEGTLPYQLIYKATQYSDFVARITEYQIQMAKMPKDTINIEEYEEKIVHHIVNEFINYDKASSAIEQYVNDLGLIVFTKFAKRIQSVIAKNFIDNPLSTAMFLASQYFVVDTDDINEQFLPVKDFSYGLHNPIDNFINAITPSSYRWWKGDI